VAAPVLQVGVRSQPRAPHHERWPVAIYFLEIVRSQMEDKEGAGRWLLRGGGGGRGRGGGEGYGHCGRGASVGRESQRGGASRRGRIGGRRGHARGEAGAR
jgi:hypothetical protein